MQLGFKIDGLKDVERAILAAFPGEPRKQRAILNQTMAAAAKNTMLPVAKSRALQGDGSGALSESLGIRALPANRAFPRGVVASVEMVPVRNNTKAIQKYANYYYARLGKTIPNSVLTSGIRHGHLVEFGTVKMAAQPFLWNSAQEKAVAWSRDLGNQVRVVIEKSVRRAAKRTVRKSSPRKLKTFDIVINE